MIYSEESFLRLSGLRHFVAPYMGAWVEIWDK